MTDQFQKKLERIPANPGVYLMKDANGHVIYIGKAKVLKNRVRSYFAAHPTDHSPKTRRLVKRIMDFECIVTGSELEALILESNLIKKWKPRYNIMVKDDKHFPYIRVRIGDPWPIIEVVRKIERDGHRYFGPYVPAKAVWSTLKFIKKHFQIADCNWDLTKVHPRPCLSFQLKQCVGPCIRHVTEQEYREVVREVLMFLSGRREALLQELSQSMEVLAENLEYERAARVRDKIFALNKILERQKIISGKLEDQDIVALLVKGKRTTVQVFHVRQGKLLGRSQQSFPLDEDTPEPELLATFMKQFYKDDTVIPKEVVLQYDFDDLELVQEWLSQRKGEKVTLTVPQRGRKAHLVDMLSENIRKALSLQFDEKTEERSAAVSLAGSLEMSEPPARVECYDISHISGTFAVGSMVVWQNGALEKKEYRRFKVQCKNTPDDYEMMKEVLTRRFTGSLADTKTWPDLLVLDGGKGQLNMAVAVLEEAGITGIRVIGLAKGPHRDRNDIYIPGRKNPLSMNRHLDAVHLLARIRDEAHRFAITYHRKLRTDASRKSILEELPGIGAKRKKDLLRHFGSLKRVREASLDALLSAPGMTRKSAEVLYGFFHPDESLTPSI